VSSSTEKDCNLLLKSTQSVSAADTRALKHALCHRGGQTEGSGTSFLLVNTINHPIKSNIDFVLDEIRRLEQLAETISRIMEKKIRENILLFN